MSGVGRGRGAVLPAWMQKQGGAAAGSPASPVAAQAATAAPGALAGSKRPQEIRSSYEEPAGGGANFHTKHARTGPSPYHAAPGLMPYQQPGYRSAAPVAAYAGAGYYAAPVPQQTAAEILPPGWEKGQDPTTKGAYYYNRATGESSWTKPVAKPAPSVVAASSQVPAATASGGAHAPRTLPKGWESAADPTTKVIYYFSRSTGERRWTFPEADALEEQKEAQAGPGAKAAPSAPAVVKPQQTASGVSAADFHAVASPAMQSAGAQAIMTQPQLPILSPGWTWALDTASGATYYYNEALQLTQWHPPTAAEAVAPPPAQAAAPPQVQRPAPAAAPASSRPKREGQLDPMDPAAYSDTPRGGWKAGLGGKDSDF